MRPGRPTRSQLLTLICGVIGLCCSVRSAAGGEVVLKSGFRVSGLVLKLPTLTLDMAPVGGEVPGFPFLMVDDGMRRYYVWHRLIAEPPNFDVELAQNEKFDLPQKKPNAALTFESVGPFLQESPFDNFGHRQVRLMGPAKKPVDVFQAIMQLRPQSCTVASLNYQWEFSVSTTSLPPDKLDAMIRRRVNAEKPDERFAVARFYQQAGLYLQSLKELETMAKDFPDWKVRIQEVALQSRQLLARRLLQELKDRRAAGQHRLAIAALETFPTTDLGADILRELRQFQQDYTTADEKIDRVKHLLGDLQAGLNAEQVAQVAPLRDEVIQQLDWETLPRFEPFLRLEKDDSLTAAEKLALAYSAWVVGDANAISDLSRAVNWWQARFHILQYLRASHPRERQEALAALTATEGIGVKTVEQLIPHLAAVTETLELRAGQAVKLTTFDPSRARDESSDAKAYRYWVLAPPEFHPRHSYPLIIALHEGGLTPERELQWWGGDETAPLQSQRHGYIVIAPEYLPPKPGAAPVAPAETIVWECLRDARRRFNIDSDRVFLSGHGRGAEAAFDVALARPDLFAGVLPISGGVEGDSKKLKDNAKHQAWYLTLGEFDFGLFNRQGSWLQSLMLGGCDMLVSQYKARGHESFYSEIHRLFEWMGQHRRLEEPKEFEFRSLKTIDVRLHWLRWSEPPRVRNEPVTVSAKVLPGQTDRHKIVLRPARGPFTLWLNSKLVDFDKRLHVEINGARKFNDFVQPEIESVLEDFRQSGDRQRLHSVRIFVE